MAGLSGVHFVMMFSLASFLLAVGINRAVDQAAGRFALVGSPNGSTFFQSAKRKLKSAKEGRLQNFAISG
jgi:hypothetical protein